MHRTSSWETLAAVIDAASVSRFGTNGSGGLMPASRQGRYRPSDPASRPGASRSLVEALPFARGGRRKQRPYKNARRNAGRAEALTFARQAPRAAAPTHPFRFHFAARYTVGSSRHRRMPTGRDHEGRAEPAGSTGVASTFFPLVPAR